MWRINLENTDICEDFVRTCMKYNDLLSVDIRYGQYMIDGTSLLGVMSLLLHDVEIWIRCSDKEVVKDFKDEIMKIGAYKV